MNPRHARTFPTLDDALTYLDQLPAQAQKKFQVVSYADECTSYAQLKSVDVINYMLVPYNTRS